MWAVFAWAVFLLTFGLEKYFCPTCALSSHILLSLVQGQLEITENENGNGNGKEEKVVKYSSSLVLVELHVAVVNNKAYMTVTQNHQ